MSASARATYTVNCIYLWTGGTDQAVVRVALRKGSGLRIADIKDRLREELPKQLEPWLEQQLAGMSYSPSQAKTSRGADEFLVRAGRRRQSGHDLRLPHAGGSGGQRAQTCRQPGLRRKSAGRDGQDRVAARPAVRAGHGLSADHDQRRPRASRPRRRHLVAGLHGDDRSHLLKPLRSPGVLGRSQERHRLPGAVGGAAGTHRFQR